MAECCQRIAIRTVTTVSDWIPVVTPIACDTFSLVEESDLAFLMSTDLENPAAQGKVKPGRDFGLLNTPNSTGRVWPGESETLREQYGTRFVPNQILCYVKSADGNPVVVTGYFAG